MNNEPCSTCGGTRKVNIGCVIGEPLTAACPECSAEGRPRRTAQDYQDKGIPHEEVFDQVVAQQEAMPRRYCSVHNREEYKYESLEHELDQDTSASAWVTNKLRPEHKCKPLARAMMMEGRDWWIGELLEPVPEWPHETHCLHMKTPLKNVSFLCNAGDFEQLLALSNVVVKLENLSWLRAATASAQVRLLPPFAPENPNDH